MIDKVNLSEAVADVSSPWVPKVIGAYNDETVEVLRVEGEFVWHHHDRTDNLFLGLGGSLVVQMRGAEDVELGPGELFVVPMGIEHRLRSDAGATVLCIERLGDVDADPRSLVGGEAPVSSG